MHSQGTDRTMVHNAAQSVRLSVVNIKMHNFHTFHYFSFIHFSQTIPTYMSGKQITMTCCRTTAPASEVSSHKSHAFISEVMYR